METRQDREQLIDNVKNWIDLDEELKVLRKKARKLREQKKDLTSSLVSIMKNNDIDCFDVNNGQLIRTTRQVKTPLSKKHLQTSLTQYFRNDPKVVKELGTFIMNSRTSKTKEDYVDWKFRNIEEALLFFKIKVRKINFCGAK